VLFAGAAVLPATAAHADLGACTNWYPTETTFSVNCSQSGQTGYRAMVKCYYLGSDNYTWRYGPWRYASHQTSTAVCPAGTEAADGSVQRTYP
jgi:hypothetical protein